MNTTICPTCSASIPSDAPGAYCPACILRDAADLPALAGTAPSLEEVAVAFPSLEILALIGQGGMGSVYKVRQTGLDRVVALKILAPALSRDPAFAERFAREARMLGKLNHPNIVTVYEHGQSELGGRFYYLVMEYVDGVNLRQAMRAGRFTPEQALGIVPGICDALQAAHAQGIWHRDIKPENILLDARGAVKIVDFGIARLVGDQTRNFTLTGTGNALGSIAYMAPEQHEKPHAVDHRADIYSLGVVIYEMLTGELPLGRFPAPSQRAEVNARIDEIVFKTLEKVRELRQQSAEEVKTDVQGAAAVSVDSHISRTDIPKHPFQLTIIFHAVLFALVAAIFFVVFPRFAEIFREMGVPGSFIPRLHPFATVSGLLFFAVLFGIDVGLCFLVRKFGGRRGLRHWTLAVILLMFSAIGVLSGALYLPLKSVIDKFGGADHVQNSLTARTPLQNATVPFLDWAQGEWVLDRDETLRAIALLIPDEEKRKLVLEKVSAGFAPHIDSDRLRFLPDAVKSWQVGKLGVPVPAGIPSFGKLTISPLPKSLPESPEESLEVTLQLMMQSAPEVEPESRPSTFSKTKEGLLQWNFEYNGEKRLAVYRRDDETQTTAAASSPAESWHYPLRHLDAARLERQMLENPQPGVATKVEAGVVTLTGLPETVRPLATMLRVLDQPEVKDPLQLPLFNMPPDFFTRLSIPGLMMGTELKDSLFDPAFFEILKRENITAAQLAHALRAHVLELENATFVNTGTPFESIINTPGASTYYDGTIPCADQPGKPLTFRIRRTTQMMGTKPDIAGFAPWLIEEAKKQSTEPIMLPIKVARNNMPGLSSNPKTPARQAEAPPPAEPIIVELLENGLLTFNRTAITPEQLEGRLSAAAMKHKNQRVIIRARNNENYQRFHQVTDLCYKAGILKLSFESSLKPESSSTNQPAGKTQEAEPAGNPATKTLAQDAALLASTKGRSWKSGVLDLRRANGHQFQSILILEFAPFAGSREDPPDASVKVSSTSPAEGPFKVSVSIGNSDFSDVRLTEKDGLRTLKITQALETVDHPTEATGRILNDYRSMSFGYELTPDTLTLKGFPADEITWGSMGFLAPAREIVFKPAP